MTDINDFHGLAEYRQWVHMRRVLENYPLSVIREKGLANISQVDSKVHGTFYHELVDVWRKALEDPSGDNLRVISEDTSSKGVMMRQLSPLYGIMDPDDWHQVIKDTRDEQKRFLPSA